MDINEARKIITNACTTDINTIGKQQRSVIQSACRHLEALKSATPDDLADVDNVRFLLQTIKPPAKRKR